MDVEKVCGTSGCKSDIQRSVRVVDDMYMF